MSEKVTVKVERNILHLPAIALRGLVVFPNNLLHFEVGRDKSIAAVEWAVRNKSEVFLIAQKSPTYMKPLRKKFLGGLFFVRYFLSPAKKLPKASIFA